MHYIATNQVQYLNDRHELLAIICMQINVLVCVISAVSCNLIVNGFLNNIKNNKKIANLCLSYNIASWPVHQSNTPSSWSSRRTAVTEKWDTLSRDSREV